MDIDDNELGYLELIHLFVEVLDHYFNYVKEIHLVYNFHKVFVILDEVVLSGEPQESSKKVSTCKPSLTKLLVHAFLLLQRKITNTQGTTL